MQSQGSDIYYCRKGILIGAVCYDTSGAWSALGDTLVLLPLDASPELIGVHVLASIRASRAGLTENEIKQLLANMFTLAGVKSWTALEKSWNLIQAYVDDNGRSIVICPMRQYETGGYVTNEGDQVYRIPFDADAIGQMVRRVIDSAPLGVVPHEPSHT